MYSVFNKKTVSGYILQDEICKGYSVHSYKGILLWEKLLNCLYECFCEEFGDIKIINTIPQINDARFLCDFYGEHFYRIENRIPKFIDDKGDMAYITTDALPYLATNLKMFDRLFSTYTVVRPRNFAVKPFLREEFIRYFQFVISSNTNDIKNDIKRIENAITRFFRQIRMPVVLVDRHSDSYYFKKSCFHSVWINENIESVLQCGVLKKTFDTISDNNKIAIDIGGAQRLLASFMYVNSDVHGLFLPYSIRDYDIIIRVNKKTEILNEFIKGVSQAGCRIKYVYDDLSFKKIKKIAYNESAIAVVVQRKIEEKDFLTIYNRDMTKSDIYFEIDIQKWILQKFTVIEKLIYDKQYSVICSRINGDKLYFKNNKSYTIVKDGLFN